jgi:hypothetical protein
MTTYVEDLKDFLRDIGYDMRGMNKINDGYQMAQWFKQHEKDIYNCMPHSREHVEFLKSWQRLRIRFDYLYNLGRIQYELN